MPEKSAIVAWVLGPQPAVHSWFKILIMCVFLGILIVWGIDGLNVSGFHQDFVVLKLNGSETLTFVDSNFRNLSVETNLERHQQIDLNVTIQILAQTHENRDPEVRNRTENVPVPLLRPEVSANTTPSAVGIRAWISSELEANYSSNLLAQWLTPGGLPCKDSRTANITIPSLDGSKNIELSSGEIHEFVFRAVDESGEPHCLGGDYFETDLSGEKWKARPPVKDLGNGTYALSLQVHPGFAGDYNLTIILLYRHYEGLEVLPARFVFDKILRVIPIKFVYSSSSSKLRELRQCKKTDYTKDVWSGRWTRHARNDSCSISRDGRYRCLERSFPCRSPWCDGPLGVLESNGWVYSAHCSFKFFSSEAWVLPEQTLDIPVGRLKPL